MPAIETAQDEIDDDDEATRDEIDDAVDEAPSDEIDDDEGWESRHHVMRGVVHGVMYGVALGVVVAAAAVLAVLLHRNGHARGDDFALYLRQA
ncbi:MAG TPA: hypothetical protein VFV63_02100, partial [Ilumatobacteraceae bacterium]|nr:hypothetical protein [Ilumatobacteraceae bacterium]